MHRSVTNERLEGEMDRTESLRPAPMVHLRWITSPSTENRVSQQLPPSPSDEQVELRLTKPPFTTPCTRPSKPYGDENTNPIPEKRRRTSPPPSKPTPGGSVANTKRPDTPRKSPSNGLPVRYEVLVPRRGHDVSWTREQFRAYLKDRFQGRNTAQQGHGDNVDTACTPQAL